MIRKIICDPRFFPSVLIVLDLFAAARYAMAGDVRHTIYWFAAGVLTTTVPGVQLPFVSVQTVP